MRKVHVFILTLIFCSSTFAEQIVLVCERPAWNGKESCGPNNTYETYRLSLETDDFDKKGGATYGYQNAKDCDASKATKIRSKFTATKDIVRFQLDTPYKFIEVNRELLNGRLSGRGTSRNLTCDVEEGSSEAWSKGQANWRPYSKGQSRLGPNR